MRPSAATSKLLRARGRSRRCGLGGRQAGALCLGRKGPVVAGGQGRDVACPREAAGASLARCCPPGNTRTAPTTVGGARCGPPTPWAAGVRRGLLQRLLLGLLLRLAKARKFYGRRRRFLGEHVLDHSQVFRPKGHADAVEPCRERDTYNIRHTIKGTYTIEPHFMVACINSHMGVSRHLYRVRTSPTAGGSWASSFVHRGRGCSIAAFR